MKKYFYIAAIVGLLGFSGCSNDEDGPEPIIDPVMYSTGAFVVNSGNMGKNIPGSLSYFDYSTGTVTNNAFYEANGQYVGDTFNDGLVWGDKIYLAVDQSNVVQVMDRGTLKLEKTIEMDATKSNPRRLAGYDNKVYVTLFTGYLAQIDPVTMSVTATVEVGPNPEAVVAYNDKLYVAVSDGYNSKGGYSEACVAVVDPKAMQVVKKINAGINLTDLATNGESLFVLSSGEYEAGTWKQINYGVKEIKNDQASEILFPATMMGINAETLYYIDNGYMADAVSYGKYDIASGKTSAWISGSDIKSPSGLGVDDLTNSAFVLSYNVGESGYADYSAAGYMVGYDGDGKKIGTYNVGIGAVRMFFNHQEK